MVTVYQCTVDLKKPIAQTRLSGLFAQEDALAHRFEIRILNGGEPVTLTGKEGVTAYFTRHADQTSVMLPGAATADGCASVTLSDACYAREGSFSLIIKVTSGSVRHAVFYGTGYVTRDRTDVMIDENDIIPSLDELLAQIARIEAATDAAETAAEDARQETQAVAAVRSQAEAALSDAQGAAAAADGWARATASITALPPEDGPTVEVTTQPGGAKHVAFAVPRGQTGATPALSIGTVQTGEPGTQAEASITGTAEAPELNLKIPRGATGSMENLPFDAQDPAALGEASPGTAETIARSDHVHPLPTASDVGALPQDGTAADSEKLGGKAPAYYVQPYNLLDNSDFTNPVNQRGQESWSGYDVYGIDRFIIVCSSGSTVSLTDGGMTLTPSAAQYAGIKQQLETYDRMAGKRYTIAVCVADAWHCAAFIMGAAAGGTPLVDGLLFFSNDTNHILLRNTAGNSAITIKRMALYEGTYTADTLPPYVPKGYAAELAACRRYYIAYSSTGWTAGFHPSGSSHIIVPLSVEDMRLAKPTISGLLQVFDGSKWMKSTNFVIGKLTTGYVISIPKQDGYGFTVGDSVLVTGSIELSADL